MQVERNYLSPQCIFTCENRNLKIEMVLMLQGGVVGAGEIDFSPLCV